MTGAPEGTSARWRPQSLARVVPALEWVPRYRRAWLAGDATAGLVVAVMLVPQSLAYAALAGMPPITGLYAALVALVVYAPLGSSGYLSVGPSAITALLVASSLTAVADGPGQYVALAGLLALLTGAIRMALGALRLGMLVSFLSQPVLTGFMSAAAVIIAVSQVRDLLGISAARSDRLLAALRGVAAAIGTIHWPTAAVGLAAVVGLVLLRRLAPRAPGPLLAAAAATAAVWAVSLDRRGVAVIGDVPAGLPSLAVPPLSPGVALDLLPAALTLALIGYVEAVSVAQALAVRSRRPLRPNQELFALGAVSVGAGLFGGFPVGGSLSRTAVSYDAGARTQLSSIIAAAVLVAVLVLLAPLLSLLPHAVLAAIVIVAITSLVDLDGIRRALRTSRSDAAALLITFAATLLLPVELGLLAGMGAALLGFLARNTRPHMAVLGRVRGGRGFRKLGREDVAPLSDVAIIRLDGPLVFMNARAFEERVRALWAADRGVRAVVIEASAIVSLDATGVETLRGLAADAEAAGLQLHFATVRGPFRQTLERVGLLEELGDRVHTDLDEALAVIHNGDGPVPDPGEEWPPADGPPP